MRPTPFTVSPQMSLPYRDLRQIVALLKHFTDIHQLTSRNADVLEKLTVVHPVSIIVWSHGFVRF
jgi:hypothetical protein